MAFFPPADRPTGFHPVLWPGQARPIVRSPLWKGQEGKARPGGGAFEKVGSESAFGLKDHHSSDPTTAATVKKTLKNHGSCNIPPSLLMVQKYLISVTHQYRKTHSLYSSYLKTRMGDWDQYSLNFTYKKHRRYTLGIEILRTFSLEMWHLCFLVSTFYETLC